MSIYQVEASGRYPSQFHDKQEAIKYAKDKAAETGKRFNIFELSRGRKVRVNPRKRGRNAGNPDLYDNIKPGSRVSIVNRFGQVKSGRAVMRGPAGWVLNMGGRHGTPDIASPENVVKVSGGGPRPWGIGNPVRIVMRTKQAAQAFAKRLGLKRFSIKKLERGR